jgi:hypothetical protein
MNNKHFTWLVVAFTMTIFSSTASAWGFAVHAYLGDELGKKHGTKNINEIYGILSPDIFNLSFQLPNNCPAELYDQTHHQFMPVWNKAKPRLQTALAYGFVAHNDTWGADSTAHHKGTTVGEG